MIDHRATLGKPRNRYPSVTTILGKTKDQTFLNQWKKKVGVAKAQKIVQASAKRGTSLHTMVENYFVDGVEGNGAWWQSIKPLLDQVTDHVWSEKPLWYDHPKLQYFGIADCLVYLNGILTLVDLKTARSPRRKEWIGDYLLQSCAYAAAVRQRFPELRDELRQTAILVSVCNQREVEEAADEGKVLELKAKPGQLFVSKGNSIGIQWNAFQERARTYFQTKHEDYCRQVGQPVIPGHCAA